MGKKQEEEEQKKKKEQEMKKLLAEGGKNLCKAAKKNNVERVKEMLEFKADPNSNSHGDSMSVDSRTPLQAASWHGSSEIVTLLIEAGASLDAQVPLKRDAALHLACEAGHTAVVKLLVDARANTKLRNDFGQDAIAVAESKGHAKVVAILKQ